MPRESSRDPVPDLPPYFNISPDAARLALGAPVGTADLGA